MPRRRDRSSWISCASRSRTGRCLLLLAFALAAGPRAAAAPAPPPARPTPSDFPTQVLPILTRSGCNSGACHGAATGQGGFRLSLLGYDPQSDYDSITREFKGRRVDRANPDDSLILAKPTLRIPHAGGLRFPATAAFYRELRAWIAAGVPYGDGTRRLSALTVAPAEMLLPRRGSTVALRVQARFADGSTEDVTRLALFSPNDDGVVGVSPEGLATAIQPGITSVMVRCLGDVAAARLGMAYGSPPIDPRTFPSGQSLDRAVFAELARLRLPPSPLASDAEFLRRVSLDLTGTLPTPTEVRGFLSAAAAQPAAAREKQIEALLLRPEFVDYWTLFLSDLLLLDSGRLGEAPARAYRGWLRSQVAANRPWNEVAADLVAAAGSVSTDGPANFYRVATDPRDLGEFVSRTFLGVRLQCARCHSHPFDRWTQTDYHRFAALFARVRYDGGRLVVAERGEVLDPKSGAEVLPAPLGLPPEAGAAADRRVRLRGWLTSPENPWFAKAFVNRIWKRLVGRGIVEPVDDLRSTNPPSNPALLAELAAGFVRSGYDLRGLIRRIVRSHTYQLTSRSLPGNRGDERFFSHASMKPLPAEVLADAIAQATGLADRYPNQPAGTRAIQLLDARVPSYTLDVFGRCTRDVGCDAPGRAGGGLSQALHLMNDAELDRKVREGVVAGLVGSGATNGVVVETLYLRTLSRPPTPAERVQWVAQLDSQPDRRPLAEDLLWALLNSREFAFNH